jgi:hypothetical protein
MTGKYPSDYDIETINELGLNPAQPPANGDESIFSTVDDETMIQRFARGKKRSVRNNNLSIDYAHNSLQLATPQGEMIAINKVANKLHYILLKQDSRYREFIHNIVIQHNFVPIDNNPTQRGFFRYQKYQIPNGYELRYTSGYEVQSFWYTHTHESAGELQLDLLFLNKSKWHRVQEIVFQDKKLLFRSVAGVIELPADHNLAWIYQLSEPEVPRRRTLPPVPPQESDILGKLTSKLAIDPLTPSVIETDPAPTITEIGTEMSTEMGADMSTTLSGMYDITATIDSDAILLFDKVFNNSNEISTKTQQDLRELQIAVLKILENYVQNGETITKTEIISDNNGKKISEKTIITNRGCPRWVIECLMKAPVPSKNT